MNSALSAHALATGRSKQDYEKQAIIMRAIHSGRSQQDYMRLNQVHLIHTKMGHSYDVWLSGIREEARHIEEDAEVARSKRGNSSGHASSAGGQASVQVSAVDTRNQLRTEGQ